MRVVLEQSWQQLTVHEQTILARLAIFQGGFRQPAAEQVAGASLLNLAALVEKSLLRVDHAAADAERRGRYHMHELLRQFAAEKLAQTPTDQTDAYTAHCHYYVHVAEIQEGKLASVQGLTALIEMKEEADNLRTGWFYAIAPECQVELTPLGQYAWPLCLFYAWRSWLHNGLDLFLRAAARLDEEHALAPEQTQLAPVLGRVLLGCGLFHYYWSDLNTTRRLYQLANPCASTKPSQPLVSTWRA